MRILNKKNRIALFALSILLVMPIILYELNKNNQDKIGIKVFFVISALFLLLLELSNIINYNNNVLKAFTISSYTFIYVGIIMTVFYFYPDAEESVIGFMLALPAILGSFISVYTVIKKQKEN